MKGYTWRRTRRSAPSRVYHAFAPSALPTWSLCGEPFKDSTLPHKRDDLPLCKRCLRHIELWNAVIRAGKRLAENGSTE